MLSSVQNITTLLGGLALLLLSVTLVLRRLEVAKFVMKFAIGRARHFSRGSWVLMVLTFAIFGGVIALGWIGFGLGLFGKTG